MTSRGKILKEKTLGCKVSDDQYKEFEVEAKQEGLSNSELLRRKLFEGGSVHNAEIHRKKAVSRSKSKRKRITVFADDSMLERSSLKRFDFPDFGILIKPYPPDCNPINYDTPEEKIGALVRRMRCLHIRAMMVQRSGSSKK